MPASGRDMIGSPPDPVSNIPKSDSFPFSYISRFSQSNQSDRDHACYGKRRSQDDRCDCFRRVKLTIFISRFQDFVLLIYSESPVAMDKRMDCLQDNPLVH